MGMRPSEVLAGHRDAIRRLVLEAGMTNPRCFGSVVHGDDREDSDLDILVDPAPLTSLLDIAKLELALSAETGAKVDLRTPKCLSSAFRQQVLEEALPV